MSELAELGTLLDKLGPIALLEAVGSLCAARAAAAPAADDDVALWSEARDVIHDAARELAGDGEDDAGDDAEDDDEARENDEDDDDEPERELDRGEACAEAATDSLDPEPHVEPQSAAPAAEETTTTMKAASPLSPKHPETKLWRCRRLLPDGKHERLFYTTADHIEVCEWPIRELSMEILRARWGAGHYVIEYYGVTDQGKLKPLGNSPVIRLAAPPAPAPIPAREESAPALPLLAAPAAIAPSSGADLQTILSLLAFLEDRSEKARASARAEAEMMLERERLASQERIAQMQAMYRSAPGARGASVDPDALAARVGEIVKSHVAEELDERGVGDDEDDEAPAAAPPADSTAAILKEVREMLAPLVPFVMAKLQTPPSHTPALPS